MNPDEYGHHQTAASPRFHVGAPVVGHHHHHHQQQQELFQSLPTVFAGQKPGVNNPVREEDIYESIYDSRWHLMNKVRKPDDDGGHKSVCKKVHHVRK